MQVGCSFSGDGDDGTVQPDVGQQLLDISIIWLKYLQMGVFYHCEVM